MKHFKDEQTLVILKPDSLQRSLVGEIIGRFERVGLKLIALKMMMPTEKHIEEHYTIDPNWRRIVGEKAINNYVEKGITPPSTDPLKISERVLNGLMKYMTSGPIIVMVWRGAHAVKLVRKLVGSTEPLSSDVGTIRGDYVLDSYTMSDTDNRALRNLIHASGSVDEAEKEIKHWLTEEELHSYFLVQEKILYDVNFDGKKE